MIGARLPARPQFLGRDEWPLVGFTTLAIAGAGLVTTPLLARLARTGGGPTPGWETAWGAILVALGLALSLVHLGRPWRAPLAVRGLARSPVSLEVVLGGATFILAAAAALAVRAAAPATTLLAPLAGVVALLFLLSLGLVYRLPAQLTWGAETTASPAVLGAAFALTLLAIRAPLLTAWALAAVALDAALFVLRWHRLARLAAPLQPAHRVAFDRWRLLLLARFLAVDAVPVGLLAAGHASGASATLTLGLLLDRIAFYALAVQRTTEAEIERVEAVLAGPN